MNCALFTTALVASFAWMDSGNSRLASKQDWVAAVQSCGGVYGALVARPEAKAITRAALETLLAKCERNAHRGVGQQPIERQMRLEPEQSILGSSSAVLGAVQKDTL